MEDGSTNWKPGGTGEACTATGLRLFRCGDGHRVDCAKRYGQNERMDRDQVIATLRAHESALKKAGIVRLALFGSTARGDQGPSSDIDLLAAFDDMRRISIPDIVGMELDLAQMLGRKVDLVEEGTLKARVQQSVEAEAVRAF